MNRMEEVRNREGWSARQLISNLRGSVGSRQSTVGSRQSATYAKATVAGSSQQFETPSSVGGLQSSVSSNQSAEGKSASGQGNASEGAGRAAGQKKQGKKAKGGVFKGLISGTIISESLILKDIRYTALVASLAIIFIANKFNAEKVERQIIVLEQEARDMRAESLSVSAELGSVSRQSEITELVKERGLGLEELREPPYRIVVNE
jgi:hypothetical protein